MGPLRSRAALATAGATAVLSLATTTASPPAFPAPAPSGAAPAATPGAAAAPTDADGWSVVDLGGGSYEVSWTSPDVLPTTSDRPTITGEGLTFGAPTIAEDGATVTAVVTADSPPDPDQLDVVLSGDRLDESGFDPSTGGGLDSLDDRVTTDLAATDPGLPGPYAVTTSDYEWDPVPLPGMPEPIEMVGHVVEPALGEATGPRPLILFMHGRHSVCYVPGDVEGGGGEWPCQAPAEEIPSHLGYDYAQQVLASQGYTTVSVRVNGINAQDFDLADGGADARAAIVQEHLDGWVDLAPEHLVDLEQVVLVGHSRGGEGVDRASIQVPTSAPYRIVGQVLLAPTDFAVHTAPYVPTVTVLPYCDGDVYDLQGQFFTDVARDLGSDDPSLKSSVLVMGANHNFFNTEWTPGIAAAPAWDDWGGDPDASCGTDDPDRLSPEEQQAVGTAYVAGAVHLFAGETDYAPMFDGSPVTVGSIGDADVLSHAVGGGRDVRRPGPDARPTAGEGADLRLCRGVQSWEGTLGMCGRQMQGVPPHWLDSEHPAPARKFLELAWEQPGARGGLRFDEPLDLSGGRLEIRTILDPAYDAPDVRVRIADSTGAAVTLDPLPGTEPLALPTADGAVKYWGETVAVDATGAGGVDLADITSVELVADDGPARVWLADVAAAPATAPAVPDERLATISLQDVEVDEGGEGTHVARVPFTITGTVTEQARFVAYVTGVESAFRQRLVVDVAPGQTQGTFPVEYTGDDEWGFDLPFDASIWPQEGLTTDDYTARLTVVDDEPDPVITIERPDAVGEGATITYKVRVEGERNIRLPLYALVVDGLGEDLRHNDMDPDWVQRYGDTRHPTRPLWRTYVGFYTNLKPGEDTWTFRMPTRRDQRAEGPEYLTFDFSAGPDLVERVRVKVRDRS